MDQYDRYSQRSVTLFLHHQDKYLFIKRNLTKKVDPGRLNGIGGRCEFGENYLDTAIRETKEESGFVVRPEQVKLSAVVTLSGGYPVDWIMCFFSIEVDNFELPIGDTCDDGDLIWLSPDEIFNGQYDLVDDLNYCFNDIVEQKGLVFLTAKLDDGQKVIEHTKNYLK
jgi:8-oxo-dGTP pyrophosphatase MutT (NUDIX family)